MPEPRVISEILPGELDRGLLHIIVFGPGRGEAVAVLFPDRSVGVIDGCREPKKPDGTGDPMREFLAHLRAETSGLRIRFVCLTHPHDDHYPGLGRLIEAYREHIDEVWCPFRTGDRYAQAYRQYEERQRADPHGLAGSSGIPDQVDVDGLGRVFAAMLPPLHADRPRLKLVHDNSPRMEEIMGKERLTVCGVGPSPLSLELAQRALVQAVQENNHRRFDPNDASGALLIRWGRTQVLLAGDLTRGRGPQCGWNDAKRYIKGRVHVVNVAHHASAGAYHDELWQAMRPALAIVTPFQNASRNQPPKPADIDRLLRDRARVVITAPPQWDRADPAAPLPWPEPLAPTAATRSGSRESGLYMVPAPGPNALRNAAAVSLDPSGRIRKLLLSGSARLYQHTGTFAPTVR